MGARPNTQGIKTTNIVPTIHCFLTLNNTVFPNTGIVH